MDWFWRFVCLLTAVAQVSESPSGFCLSGLRELFTCGGKGKLVLSPSGILMIVSQTVTSGLLPGMRRSAITTPRISFIEFIVIARDFTQPVTIGSLPVWSARLSSTLEIIFQVSFRVLRWGHSLTSIRALLAFGVILGRVLPFGRIAAVPSFFTLIFVVIDNKMSKFLTETRRIFTIIQPRRFPKRQRCSTANS